MLKKSIIFAFFLFASQSYCTTANWVGTTNGQWTTNTNWNPTTVPGSTAGDVAVLSGTMNTNITLGATQTLGELDFTASSTSYTITSGGGGFIFQASSGNAIITMSAGTSANTIDSTVPITLMSPLTITQNSSNNLTLGGVITGTTSMPITLNGTGTLVLSGNNSASYTGNFTISTGTLSVANDNSLGALGNSLTISNGVLLYTAASSPSRPFSLTGNANIQNSSGGSTLSGLISGNGSLTVGGSGGITLSGANTYLGGTTISNTTLTISNNSNLGDPSGALNFANGQLTLNAGFAIGRSGFISGNSTISSAFANPFSGNFSGSGNLTLTGGGTITLTGTNTYSGGTTIALGTTLSGTTTGIQGNITNNGTLNFNQSSAGTYSGVLTGAGPLNMQGSGNVSLTGSSPGFTGTTTVQQGTLTVNGLIANSPVMINSGATLSGSGTVGITTSSGLIDPGSGVNVGTLTINGTLTMMPGANTNISTAPQSSDSIAVVSTAAITGPLQVDPTPAFYGFDPISYTILTSTGLAGTFSPVTSTSSGFVPTVSYTATDAILNIQVLEPFAVFPFSNENTAAVGNNLDELFTAGQLPLDIQNAFSLLVGQNSDFINSVLDQMHPAPYSAFAEMQAEINGQLISHFHRLPYMPCACKSPNRFWIDGFGNSLTMKRDKIQIGFQANTGGIALGYDGQINENFVLGIGGAWSNNHLHWHDGFGHGSVNGLYGSLYTDSQIGNFYFGAAFLGGIDFYHTSRNIQFLTFKETAHAQFEALDLTGQIAMAYLFGFPQAFFYPFAHLDYLYLQTFAFSESGAGGFNLDVDSRSDGTLRTEMGLGLQVQDINAAETMCISPNISIGWVNMCPLQRPKLSSTFEGASIPFNVVGWDKTWNLLNVNFALTIAYRCFSTKLNYNVEFSPDSRTILYNQHGNLRLDWKW